MHMLALLFLALQMPSAVSPEPAGDAPFRAFTASSYWNTPAPADAPVDPASARIIEWLKNDNKPDYVRIAGVKASGVWGSPIFWAKDGDPAYAVQEQERKGKKFKLPPEFASLRIPKGARPDPTSDAEFAVYDLARGYVAHLWAAQYDPSVEAWSAGGGAIHYLESNGLDGAWTQFPDTDPRNCGHRGVPAPVMAVRLDEIQAGAVRHVLKVAVNTTKAAHVFPMVGDEHGTEADDAPPEGARLRIKPSVDLAQRDLSPAARAIAVALQQYGAVIGDQSGGPINLKVENTMAEGRGPLWEGVLTDDALASIPLDDYEILQLGYGENGPQGLTGAPPAKKESRRPTGERDRDSAGEP